MSIINKNMILLVEDDPIIAMSTQSDLEKFGHKVITVYSGEEALDLCKSSYKIDSTACRDKCIRRFHHVSKKEQIITTKIQIPICPEILLI